MSTKPKKGQDNKNEEKNKNRVLHLIYFIGGCRKRLTEREKQTNKNRKKSIKFRNLDKKDQSQFVEGEKG